MYGKQTMQYSLHSTGLCQMCILPGITLVPSNGQSLGMSWYSGIGRHSGDQCIGGQTVDIVKNSQIQTTLGYSILKRLEHQLHRSSLCTKGPLQWEEKTE